MAQKLPMLPPDVDWDTYARALVANGAHFPGPVRPDGYVCFKCAQSWPCESALWSMHVLQKAHLGRRPR